MSIPSSDNPKTLASHNAERQLSAQHAVTRLLADAPSIEEAIPGVLEAICSELDWPVGEMWIVDQEAQILRCLNVFVAPGVPSSKFEELSRSSTFGKGTGLPGRVWASREPAFIEDVTNDANFPRAEAARQGGLVSAFAFPIALNGETVAVMEFFAREHRGLSADSRSVMSSLGNQIGQFMERKWAEEERGHLSSQLASAEARYRNLFAGVQDTVLVADKSGRYLDANPAASELLGYAREELLALSVHDIVASGPQNGESEHGHFVENGGWVGEIELRRKDGSTVPVEARASVVELPEGAAYVSVAREVTDRRAVEAELHQLVLEVERARARVDNLVSSVPGVVWEAYGLPDAASQRIDFVSGYVEQMLGYSVDEWLSTPNFWLTIVHPGDKERAAAEATAIFNSKKNGSSEFRWMAKDGRAVWVESQSGPVLGEDGDPIGMRGVTLDITQRHLVETQVRETEERFSKAFHASPAGLAIVTANDRRFLDVNESFLGMMNYERADVVGRLVDEVGIWPQADERSKLERAITEGQGRARNVEVVLRTRTGELRSVLGSAEVITLGGEQCILTLMYDITERKRVEEQLQLLSEASAILASSLDYEQTLADVARLVTGRVGDVCSVDMVEGASIRRVALVFSDATQQEAFDGMPRVHTPGQGTDHPIMRVATTGESETFERMNDEMVQTASRSEEHYQLLRGLGIRSGLIVPLVAGGRRLGALTIVATSSGRVYNDSDLEFAEELARRAGLAIDNALQYQAQQSARQLAEQAAGRTQRLQSVTAALSESLSTAEVGRVVIRAAQAIGAKSGVIVRLGAIDNKLELIAAEGVVQDFFDTWDAFAADPPPQTIDGMRTGEPAYFSSHGELMARFPELSALGMIKDRSFGTVPLRVENSVIGGMVLTFDGAPPDNADREFVIALSRQCAQALERARLYEAEKRALEEAEASGKRQAFLAEASAALASSLDYEVTLAIVAKLCVPFLGDWCSIDILENGALDRVAVVHSDPAKVEWAERLREKYPPDMEAGNLKRVLQGESFLYEDIPDELLVETIDDPDLLQVMREMGLRSAITVPLRARARTVGMLTLVTAESGRHYTATDLALAEDLGHRSGLAVDNARLYAESQATQEELRRANEAKDEFLGLVSHELRTPITTIYGGARLLRSRGDSLDAESRNGVLNDIEHESERLHRIVEDLLVLARVELGQEVITEPVLVQRVVEKTANAFARRRPGRMIQIDTVAGLPAVRASNVYLEQILRNLINNADKYSPADRPIDVTAVLAVNDEVHVSVLDRGPGIAAEEMDLIFERFYRSEGTAKQAGGAGIGLTVCRRLLEAQGGRIWAEQRKGGGLIISFSLPCYDDDEDLD